MKRKLENKRYPKAFEISKIVSSESGRIPPPEKLDEEAAAYQRMYDIHQPEDVDQEQI